PVSRKKTAIILVAETFGDLVAVEFDRAAAAQIGGAHAYCCFKRDQLTRFSSHRRTIRRYMLIVKCRVRAGARAESARSTRSGTSPATKGPTAPGGRSR